MFITGFKAIDESLFSWTLLVAADEGVMSRARGL